jgi:outer membrane protein
MKNLSIILNAILFVLVAFLFYKIYSGKPATNSLVGANKQSNNDTLKQGVKIAFVELDSLNNQVKFIKNKRTELEDEQKRIETEWQAGYRNLENKKNEFLKRGNAITQQEAEKFQGELMQQQQQVDGRKQKLSQDLSEKSYKFLEDMQNKLKAYLVEYNKDNKYQFILTVGAGMDYMLYKDESLDITKDVIVGLNEKLK